MLCNNVSRQDLKGELPFVEFQGGIKRHAELSEKSLKTLCFFQTPTWGKIPVTCLKKNNASQEGQHSRR